MALEQPKEASEQTPKPVFQPGPDDRIVALNIVVHFKGGNAPYRKTYIGPGDSFEFPPSAPRIWKIQIEKAD